MNTGNTNYHADLKENPCPGGSPKSKIHQIISNYSSAANLLLKTRVEWAARLDCSTKTESQCSPTMSKHLQNTESRSTCTSTKNAALPFRTPILIKEPLWCSQRIYAAELLKYPTMNEASLIAVINSRPTLTGQSIRCTSSISCNLPYFHHEPRALGTCAPSHRI